MIQFDFSGLKELEKAISDLPQKIIEGVVKGVNDVSDQMETDAKDFVDSNGSVITGNLRESIHAVPAHADGEAVEGGAFTSCEYAAYVEMGTGEVGRDTPVAGKYPDAKYHEGKWRGVIPDVGPRWIAGQPAQPFMYPALALAEQNALETVGNAVEEKLKE